jgi:polyhydroxyalkanoate synthesis repressor PhaR
MPEKLLLKKYANRRLYDTEKSAYVTLSQVAEMIKQGREVEVIDADTKADVTAFILTQIVLEEAKKKTAFLPVSFLYLIIRYGETVLSEFFEKYLEQTFKNYLAYKAAVDEQFRTWLDLGADLSNMVQKTMEGFPPFKPQVNPFSETTKQKEREEPEG